MGSLDLNPGSHLRMASRRPKKENNQATSLSKNVKVKLQKAATPITNQKGGEASTRPTVGDIVVILTENDRQSFGSSRVGTKGMKGIIENDDQSDQPYQIRLESGLLLPRYKESWVQKGQGTVALECTCMGYGVCDYCKDEDRQIKRDLHAKSLQMQEYLDLDIATAKFDTWM